jgi:uncharacterized protein DUF6966
MDLEALLDQHRVSYVEYIRTLLESARVGSDEEVRSGVRQLFRGTMGSLTDLYITRKNGHEVDDEDKANAALQSITDRLWILSK